MVMVILRSANADDDARVAFIYREARTKCLAFLPELHTRQEDLAFFRRNVFKNHDVLLAECDGVTVGYSAASGDWLRHLYVLPDHHGRGIGTALLNRAKSGRDALCLWVFQRNHRAIRFYGKHGFALLRSEDGSSNPEGEPDAVYRWQRASCEKKETA